MTELQKPHEPKERKTESDLEIGIREEGRFRGVKCSQCSDEFPNGYRPVVFFVEDPVQGTVQRLYHPDCTPKSQSSFDTEIRAGYRLQKAAIKLAVSLYERRLNAELNERLNHTKRARTLECMLEGAKERLQSAEKAFEECSTKAEIAQKSPLEEAAVIALYTVVPSIFAGYAYKNKDELQDFRYNSVAGIALDICIMTYAEQAYLTDDPLMMGLVLIFSTMKSIVAGLTRYYVRRHLQQKTAELSYDVLQSRSAVSDIENAVSDIEGRIKQFKGKGTISEGHDKAKIGAVDEK